MQSAFLKNIFLETDLQFTASIGNGEHFKHFKIMAGCS